VNHRAEGRLPPGDVNQLTMKMYPGEVSREARLPRGAMRCVTGFVKLRVWFHVLRCLCGSAHEKHPGLDLRLSDWAIKMGWYSGEKKSVVHEMRKPRV
jgi:hypothetical protein